jgi:hypothetical protein
MVRQQSGRCRTSADYFLSEDVIKSYKASDPEHPVIFRRGDLADAEPAVPGWRLPVDDLFESQ